MPRGRPRQTTPERHARNEDYTDREILFNMQRALDADGWVSTTNIAIACGFTGNGQRYKTPAVKIASRLVAMRRGGLVESTDPDYTLSTDEPGARDTRWRPTEVGLALINGKLSQPVLRAMQKMDPGAYVLMMREIAQQAYVSGDLGEAFAVRREFQHHLAKRKLVYLDRFR